VRIDFRTFFFNQRDFKFETWGLTFGPFISTRFQVRNVRIDFQTLFFEGFTPGLKAFVVRQERFVALLVCSRTVLLRPASVFLSFFGLEDLITGLKFPLHTIKFIPDSDLLFPIPKEIALREPIYRYLLRTGPSRLVLSPRPGPDGPNASGWYRRLRKPISSLSLLNCDQLWTAIFSCVNNFAFNYYSRPILRLLPNIQNVRPLTTQCRSVSVFIL